MRAGLKALGARADRLRVPPEELVETGLVLLGRWLWRVGPGIIGVALFLGLWQLGNRAYGSFILPSPLETGRAILGVLSSPEGWGLIAGTVARVGLALGFAALFGVGLGLASGYARLLRGMLAPVSTILLGMPATAWVILTMIWFGPSHASIVFTIAMVTTPLLYIGTVDAVLTRDRRLEDMAAAFGAGPWRRFSNVALRQILATLAPVTGITLALGFKVAIMAELVANVAGLGGALATARAHMDIDRGLAYVALTVAALLAVEYGLIRPFQRRVGQWKRGGLI
ncbi:ABC transporter permease subunit [Roseibacterium beibuensis]|uniref:ABC transporter permease n=1 Tax=[Roseibacterium] beibuensis TaxID=1193142 RepID=A0ABP9LL53_9RHOB|nr:ABC transporter permease subunit [Roseibacterium beibuensis]MCS6626878.1 ABC transporter permease subunit [Roseibacterium beibuensis]